MTRNKTSKTAKKRSVPKKAAGKTAKKSKPSAGAKKLKAAVRLTKTLKKAAVIPSGKGKAQPWRDFITPLDDRILVQVETMTKTAGGLFIPGSVNERPTQGHVIAVGRGHRDKKGRLRPMDVRLGDTVMFAPVAGVDMTLQDQDVLILRESDILGIIER